MIQPISAGIVSALTGFASSFVLVVAGLRAVGATGQQASSGLLAVCVISGLCCILLAWRFRMPISFAWSTPGAALLVAAAATTDDFGAAVGAFLVCGTLILLCGLWPALGRAITRIPKPLASAMLAGILFPICLAPITAAVEIPWLALPVILTWLVLFRFAPRWAVPAAMVVALVGIGVSAGPNALAGVSLLPQVTFVVPQFDPLVIVSLGLPLFIVTMAGQNVPGFAVMSTFGYTVPPRPALLASGLGTMAGSFFGGHAVNLAAITAALMAGPDSHPDKSKRWVATVTSGILFIVLGLAAGVATALISAAPPVLITAVAGLALLGALVSAVVSALENPAHRIPAIATFLVTASGVVIVSIGSAFWGLLVGGVVMLWSAFPWRRSTPRTVAKG
ncbi:benzoate/H(+) symporter BenE family transporter [Herbiconiux sp. CPCC 203407]|uniref:Benzoate/H(+) symporter BenE family transporter n=1 Tax=Herbiconiux oxytropis TaxID=2970915 RepID=A0AA41X9X8_9MICO|nr:benzoate/H(+) symporter BenE family transporter [Herbiconiux oxytropis]MCS5720874.1 benzoate/H(+) symporter BenE family transporter [Herbiconiux oxytropis]MCS5724351.1 benzoate/H(+) symporter BenE family transporter [Herbiconiux oxytropis]